MAGKIYYGDVAGIPTAIVSGEKATFEKEYAVDYNQKSKWDANNPAGTFLLDFGGPILLKACYVGGSSILSFSPTFELQAGTTSATTDFSISLKTNIKSMSGYLGSKSWAEFSETYQFWKFVFDTGLSINAIVGKLALFENVYEFERNYQWDRDIGNEISFIDTIGYSFEKDREFQDVRAKRNWQFRAIGTTQFNLFDKTIRILEDACIYDDQEGEVYYGEIGFSNEKGLRCADKFNIDLNFIERR